MATKKKSLPTPTDDELAVAIQNSGKSEEVVTLEPEVTRAIQVEIHKAIVSESYSGPMPRPDHLREYDQIVSGAAKDILEEFKANGRHSREIETLAVSGAIGNDKRGQWMAFVLLLLGFGLIAFLAYINKTNVANVVAGTLLIAVIAGYLTKKNSGRANTDDKSIEQESS